MKRILLIAAVICAWYMQAWAQENSAISGVVLSAETGQPVPGASVTISGVATAITDDVGRFQLSRSQKGAIMKVSAFGFAGKDLVVKGGEGQELTIQLHDETFKSVYRSTYTPHGRREWQATTGSVTSIANEGNYKKAATSLETLVQDEGLGVNTRLRSGMPGIGGNMYIWGFSSINANTQPLILIDGVPYENMLVTPSLISGNTITPLSGLEVKDIESITVLKDATSLYGSKGGNGAILIETAKALEQPTQIDVYAYAGVNLPPSHRYRMMNAGEYRSYLYEMKASSGDFSTQELQLLPYFDQRKPTQERWGWEGNRDYYRYNQETDWQKETFQNSLSQNYYISIKGGDDVAMYSMSVGYFDHQGTVKNTDFSRYTTQFNSQINVTRRLKMYANMNVAYNDRQLIYEGLSPNLNPLYVSLIKAPFMAPYRIDEWNVATPNLEQADVFNMTNPVALLGDKTAVSNNNYRFFGNIGATMDLTKGFELSGIFGITYDKTRERIFLPQRGLYHEPLSSGAVTNEMKELAAQYLQYYGDFNLSYKQTFMREHKVSGKLGVRYQTNSTECDWVLGYNSSSDDNTSIGSGTIAMASAFGELGSWKWLSFYLNGEYSYRNRYFVSYNMAMDASSRFGKEAEGLKIGEHVYGVFPSATASWLVSSEDFMSRLSMIDMLRLRVGYSVAGNDDIGNYRARLTYDSQNLFGFYGLVRYNIANPKLKWETNTKLNAGVDVAMLNERLSLSFDVFQSKTTDLLTLQQGEGYHGISTYAVNGGTMQNRGVELGIQGRIINTAFKWDMGVNIATYRNKVTALSENKVRTEVAGGTVLTQVGSPLGQFYGYKTDGVFATQEEANAAGLYIQRGGTAKPDTFAAGDVRFVSINGDKIIDERDMTVIGDPNPDFFGSIVSRMYWKRFTLSAVFAYSYGNDVYNALRASVESMNDERNQTIAVLNRWSREGHLTNMPRAQWGDPMQNSRFSDRWIEDGSYIRLKTLSLSYDIPLSARYIKGLQVYVTGNNLFTLTKYLGYDPEFSASQSPLYYGVDMGAMPMPKSLLVGVKLGL